MSALPELPEPFEYTHKVHPRFSGVQMKLYAMNYGALCRKQALEELIAHFECKPCGYEVFGQQIADEIKETFK